MSKDLIDQINAFLAKAREDEVMALVMRMHVEPCDGIGADLRAEGVLTIEGAYLKGWRHALADLRMRMEEPGTRSELPALREALRVAAEFVYSDNPIYDREEILARILQILEGGSL